MEIDLFGIKFGKDEKDKNDIKQTVSKEVTYEIPKKMLLDKLGFKDEQVKFIKYDYDKGILTIKVKEKKEEKEFDKDIKEDIAESVNTAFGANIVKVKK